MSAIANQTNNGTTFESGSVSTPDKSTEPASKYTEAPQGSTKPEGDVSPAGDKQTTSQPKEEGDSAAPKASDDTDDNETLDIDKIINEELEEGLERDLAKTSIDRLPAQAKKIVQSMQSDYTRKTQELAAQRKELEAMKQNLDVQRKVLLEGDYYNKLKEKAEAKDPEDPWSNEGRQAIIEREVARQTKAQMDLLRNQMQKETRRAQVMAFAAQNPDIKSPEIRTKVYEICKKYPDMKLEDAYDWVKSKMVSETREKEKEAKAESRERARDVFNKTGSGKQRQVGPPKGLSAYEYVQWQKNNQ